MASDRYAFKSAWKRHFASAVDFTGGLLFRVLKTLRTPESSSEQARKILLVRLDHIGDLILTRPAVRLLREHLPAAQIDWLIPAESRTLLSCDPFINNLIPFKYHWYRRGQRSLETWKEFFSLIKQLRLEKYDAAVDFRGDFRSILLMFLAGIKQRIGYGITGGGFLLTECLSHDKNLHQVLLNAAILRPLGVTGKPEYLPLHAQPELFSALVPRRSPETKRVIVHTGAGYPSKVWSAQNLEKLLESLSRLHGMELFIIGTADEKRAAPMEDLFQKNLPSLKDLRGVLELHELPALMQNAELFIGGDSGPAHIAAAQGIMVLSIFSGANDERLWKPWTPNLHLMTNKVSCSPCGLSVCPIPDHPCMSGIRPEEVIHAATRLLEGKPV